MAGSKANSDLDDSLGNKTSGAAGKPEEPLRGIATIKYSESVGARSMADTPRHIAERNHYNYVDVEMRGETFEEIDPYEHAGLKHHSAILLYGMRQFDALTEIHLETAALLRSTEDPFRHPAWRGFFRHVRNNHDKAATDAFLAQSLGAEGALADFDWQSVPDYIRSEWILFNWHGTAGIAPQAVDEDMFRHWVKEPEHQRLVLLGLLCAAESAGDLDATGHYLALLKTIAPEVHDLSADCSVPDMFLTLKYRAQFIRHFEGASAAANFLAGFWDSFVALEAGKVSPMAHLERLKWVYERRVADCRAANDSDAERRANEQWRSVLELALERLQEGSLS